MCSKEQQLRRSSGASGSTTRQHEEEHISEPPWDLEITSHPRTVATTAPQPARKKQEYKPAESGRKHVLVRNMKRETYDKLHALAKDRFEQRDVNWLINHILDAYE